MNTTISTYCYFCNFRLMLVKEEERAGFSEGGARQKSRGAVRLIFYTEKVSVLSILKECRIGLSKIHSRFRIGPLNIHRRFRIVPPQVSLPPLPDLLSRLIVVMLSCHLEAESCTSLSTHCDLSQLRSLGQLWEDALLSPYGQLNSD